MEFVRRRARDANRLSVLLAKPGITAPIVGATKVQHLDDAFAATRLTLSSDDIARLEEPYVPHAVGGFASIARLIGASRMPRSWHSDSIRSLEGNSELRFQGFEDLKSQLR